MSYIERVLETYQPNSYAESDYLQNLDRAIKACENKQQEDKIWEMKRWVEQQNQKNSFEAQQKAKEIANRIRIFDGSMSGDEVGFLLKATHPNLIKQLQEHCEGLRQIENDYNALVFQYLFGAGKDDKVLGREYRLMINLDTEMRSTYNKVQTVLKQMDRPIKVSTAMNVEAANKLRETDAFSDYKLLIFRLHIENQYKSEEYKDSISIQDLRTCFLHHDRQIKPRVVSNSYDLQILEKSIDNPGYLMKAKHQSNNYMSQVNQLLADINRPQNQFVMNPRENKAKLHYKFEKTYKEVNSLQRTKVDDDFMGDIHAKTVVNTDPYILELLKKVKPQTLEAELKEFTRRIEIVKLKECKTPQELNNTYKFNMVGTNSEWGIFARMSPNTQYFIASTCKFKELTKFKERIQTASKMFYFDEDLDENPIKLNLIQEKVETNLKNRGMVEAIKLAKKLLFKIKLQICFKTFMDNYEEALRIIPTNSVKLKTETTSWKEVFKSAQFE